MKQNRIIGILIAFVALSFMTACASKKGVAATTDSAAYTKSALSRNILGDAIERYTPWQTARISGKLKMASLPVKPTINIFMKKDKELTISASAILVGEVFRLELNEDSLFVANKLKKVYCVESAEKLKTAYPSLCEELQSILLGRMIVPGNGTLEASNMDKVVVEMVKDMRKVSPKLDEIPLDIAFYYLIDPSGQLVKIGVDGENSKNIATLDYEWAENGSSDILATIYRSKGNISVELDLDAPKWGGEPLARFKLGKGFKRVGIKEFLKSI